MRKIHKKRILELTNTLQQACQQLNLQNKENFIGLCAEIQNFVSGMYQFIQDVLGESSTLIQFLEIFYKELYGVAQGTVPVKKLRKLAHEIEGYAKGLQPDRIEVAFFCYKASMADCFESIYFAAKADPQCDAYFIPIPYYDRNADGSFGTMHLEGVEHYPDSYELIDWKKYDVETRHPDIIFIMNPYDDTNLVTSVHPNFYSSRLKNFTDCLIYVEYGIPIWLYRDTTLAKEEIAKHAPLNPAYINCDFYIAYSQKMVCYFQTFLEVHRNLLETRHIDVNQLYHKAIALGSPKFDKIFHSKRSDFSLPDAWIEKIKTKKIVLYNTSLSELLKSTAKQFQEDGAYTAQECIYLKKMRSILDVFYKRDDVVLWWRPHPLFESTLQSMRPGLYEEYLQICQEFHSKDRGIYDTTDELHRAISWSDAMISDESSLLWLYLATGKPFYIPSISNALKTPIHHNGPDFHYPIQRQIEDMRYAQIAKPEGYNTCIWWEIFSDQDMPTNTYFDNFLSRFLQYIISADEYPEREEYNQLKKQMFQKYVVNGDGTAGEKIYAFSKWKALS